jgi:hypothetical protein
MVIKSFILKQIRHLRRCLKRHVKPSHIGLVVLICALTSYAYYMETRRFTVNPSSYQPLMNLIGSVESSNNYDAHFGNSKNTQVRFTAMTITEVLNWQSQFIASGSASSAVGRYQILNTTLQSLVNELNIDVNQKFDENMQDKMAIALFERRGSIAFVNSEITVEEFAAQLAQEWAALPKVIGDSPDSSYYAEDGLNKSRTTQQDVFTAILKVAPL